MEGQDWYVYIDDHQEGPLPAAGIRSLVQAKVGQASIHVWRDGMADWVPLTDAPEFRDLAGAPAAYAPPSVAAENVAPAAQDAPIALAVPGAQMAEIEMPAESGVVLSSGTTDTEQPALPANETIQPLSTITFETPRDEGLDNVGRLEIIWALKVRGKVEGPHSIEAIVRKLKAREISPDDSILREGWTNYVPIRNIPRIMKELSAVSLAPSASETTDKYPSLPMTSGEEVTTNHEITRLAMARENLPKQKRIMMLVLVAAILGGGYYLASTGKIAIPFLKFGSQQVGGEIPATSKKPQADTQAAKPTEPSLPAELSPQDMARLKAVIAAQGKPVLAAAIPSGQNLSAPKIVVAANLPDGTKVQVIALSKVGQILDDRRISVTQELTMHEGIAVTQPMIPPGMRLLPAGRYQILVSTGSQPTDVQLDENHFLGGIEDHNFELRLKPFKARAEIRTKAELKLLSRALATLIVVNRERDMIFAKLLSTRSPANKSAWNSFFQRYRLGLNAVAHDLTVKDPALLFSGKRDQAFLAYRYTMTANRLVNELVEKDFWRDSVKVDLAKRTSAYASTLIPPLQAWIAKEAGHK